MEPLSLEMGPSAHLAHANQDALSMLVILAHIPQSFLSMYLSKCLLYVIIVPASLSSLAVCSREPPPSK